jgi:Spy/CpxP family protein refolding chaperone
MRSLISTMLIVAGAIVSSSVIAGANQLTEAPNLPPAPIGHAQPRAEGFSPGSQTNQAEQDRLSTFDAQQQKLDEMLDKKLNICRC